MSKDLNELAYMCKDLNLLYIEDDKDARLTTLKLLNNFFNNITTAVDGQDGLDKFKESKYDLVITDINMPGLNGLEMLEEIRKINSDILVLMLSAFNDAKYFMRAIELDVDGYILKPLNQEQFINILYKMAYKINLINIKENYQKRLEKEVELRSAEIIHKLHFDSLTPLYSRYMFFNDIKQFRTPTVILIDINQFKVINEVYGTDLGSTILVEFAKFLKEKIKDDSYRLYRLSGDEFAILDLNEKTDLDKVELLISCLQKNISSLKIDVANTIVSLEVTISMSKNEKRAYECAKIALEYAKKYKKSYIEYKSNLDHRKETSLILKRKNDISLAIQEKRVVAVYQAIVDSKGKVVKHETLMRLQEKDSNKLLTPYFFLDVAIKTRLYESLSETIIFKALNSIKSTNKTLSINFTYSDIKNTFLIQKVDDFMRLNSEVGSKTVIEITENESIENYEDVKSFIKRFRSYGVKIAIDDFGTGFSNFQYILEVEPDFLKIDGSLIKDIDTNKRSLTLVEAIVKFSHKLGIGVIAEFVHSELIFNMLKDLEIDEYQGYYFSEPSFKLKD